MPKPSLCGSQQTVENSSRDDLQDHLTFLLRNLYVGQEATVRTRHGTTDWFQIGKGIRQGCILSPCLFNLHGVLRFMGSQRVGHDWVTELNWTDSAYKLKKQGDNIQPWHTPFHIWNQSVIPCLVLTVASWSAYRFLRRQVRWSGIPISLRISHSLLWSTQSKALA